MSQWAIKGGKELFSPIPEICGIRTAQWVKVTGLPTGVAQDPGAEDREPTKIGSVYLMADMFLVLWRSKASARSSSSFSWS